MKREFICDLDARHGAARRIEERVPLLFERKRDFDKEMEKGKDWPGILPKKRESTRVPVLGSVPKKEKIRVLGFPLVGERKRENMRERGIPLGKEV